MLFYKHKRLSSTTCSFIINIELQEVNITKYIKSEKCFYYDSCIYISFISCSKYENDKPMASTSSKLIMLCCYDIWHSYIKTNKQETSRAICRCVNIISFIYFFPV